MFKMMQFFKNMLEKLQVSGQGIMMCPVFKEGRKSAKTMGKFMKNSVLVGEEMRV